MAKILLIETSTEVCSAAISVDGTLAALMETAHTLEHAALLTLHIQACLRDSGMALRDLDAVALGSGPGSYTALRVGSAVAKGICYALDKPLIAIETLLALATGLEAEAEALAPGARPYYLPMLDARRNEVWACLYDSGLTALLPAQPLVLENNSFVEWLSAALPAGGPNAFVLCGNGAAKVASVPILEQTVWSSRKKCSAAYLAAWAEKYFQSAVFQNVAYFEPWYMKPPNITVPNKSL
jgi:tRNA threonylcarbamoyladenosine biosynthesis protein TsaB